jgi:hypothetical protein
MAKMIIGRVESKRADVRRVAPTPGDFSGRSTDEGRRSGLQISVTPSVGDAKRIYTCQQSHDFGAASLRDLADY